MNTYEQNLTDTANNLRSLYKSLNNNIVKQCCSVGMEFNVECGIEWETLR